MPDVFTHCHGAIEMLDRLENKKLKQEIQARRELYLLGSQGPDIFYYYHRLPFKKSNGAGEIGGILHNQKCASFFTEGLRIIKEDLSLSCKEEAYDAIAYLFGFLSHYAMDTNCHPFIYYFGGINTGGQKKYEIHHKELEMHLDQHLYYFINKDNIKNIRLSDMISPKNISDCTKAFLIKNMKSVFGIDMDSFDMDDIFLDLSKTVSILRDKHGIKRKLIRFMEKRILNIGHEYSSAIYESEMDFGLDYMNMEKTSWNHPCSEEITYQKSYVECVQEGIDFGADLMKLAFMYLDSKIDIFDLLEKFPNLSYNTGLDLDEYGKKDMRFYNCIFE